MAKILRELAARVVPFRVIATIFACRKLSALEGKPSPAREMAFRDSIDLAAEMMRRIDSCWPSSKRQCADNLARVRSSSEARRCMSLTACISTRARLFL